MRNVLVAVACLSIGACAINPSVPPPAPLSPSPRPEAEKILVPAPLAEVLDESETIPGVPDHACITSVSAAGVQPLVSCNNAELSQILAEVNRHRASQYQFEMLEPEVVNPTFRHYATVTIDPRNTEGLIRGIEDFHRMRVDHVDSAKRMIYLRRFAVKDPAP